MGKTLTKTNGIEIIFFLQNANKILQFLINYSESERVNFALFVTKTASWRNFVLIVRLRV